MISAQIHPTATLDEIDPIKGVKETLKALRNYFRTNPKYAAETARRRANSSTGRRARNKQAKK